MSAPSSSPGCDVHVDRQPRVLGDALAEHEQRARQPEVVERLGPQLAGDAAHLLEAAAGRLLRLEHVIPRAVRHVPGDAAELQHDAGQRLTHAVMELLCDPQALALLRRERAADAVAPLGLEPLEHVVEGRAELRGLRVAAAHREPATRLEQVDPARQRGQLAQRRERPAQQQEVDGQHQPEAAGEDCELADRNVVDARREDQRRNRARGGEHGRVADGDAPEERRAASTHAASLTGRQAPPARRP